ncbi:MAG: class I SAM-dependent methyltransferase [Aureispira sp.]
MNKDYYKAYYHLEREHWWFKARLDILERLLENEILSQHQDKSTVKILNAGVATGATSLMLEKYAETVSLEYDKDCCVMLKELVGIEAVNASLTALPFEDNSFDLVCAFDVIEHIEDHETALAEINRVLKPNGQVFVTVPAFEFLWSSHDDINHHKRRYTAKNLASVVKGQQFDIQFISYFNSILFPLIAFARLFLNFLEKMKGKSKEKEPQSDFEKIQTGNFINKILYFIFRMERPWLSMRFKFPAGVSLVVIGKKK